MAETLLLLLIIIVTINNLIMLVCLLWPINLVPKLFKSVIECHNQGMTDQDIVDIWPILKIKNVRAMIKYYEQHKEKIDDYLNTHD